ncbi:coat protein [Diplodia seriata chrysovirus 1]|nr:coat protein [Diplodia seriata chrysovirus 1]
MELNNKKYAEKTALFLSARQGAGALERVQRERLRLSNWSADTLEGADKEPEKQVHLGHDLGGVINYFEHNLIGALELIHRPTFDITYHVYGDVARQPVFGENTSSATVKVSWDRCPVDVELYPGVVDRVSLHEDLVTVRRQGLKYRDQIAKSTAWNRNELVQLTDDRVLELQKLIEAVGVGQNKLTRLVKGFLIYLECLEAGQLTVNTSMKNVVVYAVVQLLNVFRVPNRSYVFNSDPDSEVHTAVLKMMSEAYPPPMIQSHVTVPADGEEVFMVTQGKVPVQAIQIVLNPIQVWSSVIKYANDVGVTEYLQTALICACSLQQNRYFSRVGLPKVVAQNDLMIPAMRHINITAPRPLLSKTMYISTGRVHQMLAFMTARDIIAVGNMSTKQGFDSAASIRSYISLQEGVVEKMGSYFTDIKILDATPQFKYLSRLDEDDFDDLYQLSALEGLWLCDRTEKVVENGVIMALKGGVKDMSDETSTKDVLVRELGLMNVRAQVSKIPNGAFTVEAACLSVSQVRQSPRLGRRTVTMDVEYARACEYKPGRPERKKKQRFGPSGQVKEVPLRNASIDISAMRHRAKSRPVKEVVFESPKSQRSEMSSEPPSYSSDRSSSPISEREMPTTEGVPSTPSDENEQHQLFTRMAYEAAGSEPSMSPKTVREAVRKDHVDTLLQIHGWPPSAGRALRTMVIYDDWDVSKIAREYTIQRRESITLPGVKELDDEIIRHICRDHGMSTDDEEFVLQVCSDTKSKQSLWAHKSFGTWADSLITRGLGGVNIQPPDRVSPLLQPLKEALVFSARHSLSTDPLVEMKNQRKDWKGDVESAPRSGLKFVGNSVPWADFMEECGVSGDMRGGGKKLKYVMSEYFARNEGLSLDHCTHLANWFRDTGINLMPLDLNDNDIPSMGSADQELLPYLERDTSMKARRYAQEDSRWLILGAALPRSVMDQNGLKKLTYEFRVPAYMRNQLRTKYPLLFEEKKEARVG